ncbi:mu-type opioid receptor-like [Physella acuta]|uniref:mu-type opioid receptor-like n=1 Tax=Physella acuta TaxID=109671 RepID=UPI0027DE8E73|nr:mu-type opioid receptor-like [Physella acuta]
MPEVSGTTPAAHVQSTNRTICDVIASMSSADDRSYDVSDEARTMVSVVVSVCLCGVISLLGVFTNAMNMLVFTRQGLQDNVNISLFGLALTDLLCLVFNFWISVCYIVIILDPPTLTVDPYSLSIITASLPRVIFTRVSCWLTALISLQRCLCVALPFKVRDVFTPRTTAYLTLTISAFTFLSHMSLYFYSDLHAVLDPRSNTSKVYLVPLSYGHVDLYVNTLFFFFLPLLNFLLIFACTLGMISLLKSSTKWREIARKGNSVNIRPLNHHNEYKNQDMRESKEARVSKMIIVIMLIFITCNIPSNVLLAIRNVVPEFQENGRLKNLFHVTHALAFLLEAVNSSANFFAYFFMSSKFYTTFTSFFKHRL